MPAVSSPADRTDATEGEPVTLSPSDLTDIRVALGAWAHEWDSTAQESYANRVSAISDRLAALDGPVTLTPARGEQS